MRTRLENLRKLMADQADCALIINPINRRYFTGMKSSAGYLLVFPEDACFITDSRYIERSREVIRHCGVLAQERDLYAQIRNILNQHNAQTIAVESHDMTLKQYHKMQEKLPDFEILGDSSLSRAIYALRTVKSTEEMQKIKAAQALAEQALQDLLKHLHAGMTEREVALELDFHMRKNGAEDLSFETIALTGAHSSMPHGVPDDRIIQENSFVLMDFGAVVDGYHSDMTRTVCVGQPSQEMQEVYEIVRHAQDAAKAAARPGISGKALDAVARDLITQAGYGGQFGHSLGHGVGLEIHEYPVASMADSKILEPGNVVTIEPGIYLPGKFGVRIEDFVYITKNSCENLTNLTNTLVCV
ncbi:MAG: aminopeptidase P family protein [Oscillospiraceae bacterium]|nr:aminopeptidase P family protein [Oscillospiraceae bacterium]